MNMKLRLALATIMVLAATAAAKAADQVSVQLDWVVRGNHAMFFVARDRGYSLKTTSR
jgi:NitT/TauT family transport system substrate-binding protein